MNQPRVITWQLRLAVVAAIGSVGLLAAASWRATHFAGLPRVNAAANPPARPSVRSFRYALASELDRAIDLDPFQPERKRPEVRYAPPSSAPPPSQTPPGPPAEQVELLGTVVVGGGRSFAMCQTSAGPQIVHIGEKFAGLTLKTVEQGSAVFVSPDGKVVNVSAKKTGS
jgi:hypothetical protein